MGRFADWQPRYAEHQIATFPVRDKRPAITRYLRTGLKASCRLAEKFGAADEFGIACRPSGITVLDVDARDERLFRDALDEFGRSPFLVRSVSGNFQAWYKHNGEKRLIRPDRSRPIDILGDGYVVAPPSKTPRGCYEIIEGCLDDLRHLPVLQLDSQTGASNDQPTGLIARGHRNNSLWRQCMKRARGCSDVVELMAFALSANEGMFREPLTSDEVERIVSSAWKKELTGDNWFGVGGRVAILDEEIDQLMNDDPDAFLLKTKLRRHHWGRPFVIANAMAPSMPGGGWTLKRLQAARRRLEDYGEIEMIRPIGYRQPALYRFRGRQI